jgi:hypothetical protein
MSIENICAQIGAELGWTPIPSPARSKPQGFLSRIKSSIFG